jgi:hypothetical protein
MPTILELFAGTQSISKVFRKNGWNTFTIEIDDYFKDITDWQADISKISAADILERMPEAPSVIWASPPCQAFSVAAISKNWTKESGLLQPKSEKALKAVELVKHTLNIIKNIDPVYFFIENPRGALRKMPFMQHIPIHTVAYCQYGDTRQKPTDLWTNHENPQFLPICKAGASCHVAAPRGSQTGTQGLKTSREKAIIPEKLCEHIFSLCDDEQQLELFIPDAAIINDRFLTESITYYEGF